MTPEQLALKDALITMCRIGTNSHPTRLHIIGDHFEKHKEELAPIIEEIRSEAAQLLLQGQQSLKVIDEEREAIQALLDKRWDERRDISIDIDLQEILLHWIKEVFHPEEE